MKIYSFKLASEFLPQALEGVKQSVCVSGQDILVVSSGDKVNEMLIGLINKQLHHQYREDCTGEVQAIKDYYLVAAKKVLPITQLSLYEEEVERTIEALHQTLIEGALFRMNDKSLEDYALANGSALSAKLVDSYLEGASFIDGRSIIVSDHGFGSAVISWADTAQKVQEAFKEFSGLTVVSGGFGKTKDGFTTSLGKGGADLTATTIGAILKSESIVFHSYGDGIYDADPEVVKEAQSLTSLTYEEAAQLSFSEKGVIYPPAIWPAVKENIPIVIKNVLNPSFGGTYISAQDDSKDCRAIKGISNLSGVDLITVYGNGLLGQIGTSSKLFGLLAENGINIMFISQSSSEYSISFAVASIDGKKAVEVISKARKNKQFLSLEESVFVKKNVCVVSVCGNKMRNVPGISGKVYSALGAANVNIIASAQGGEELNISVVLDGKEWKKGVQAIYDGFLK